MPRDKAFSLTYRGAGPLLQDRALAVASFQSTTGSLVLEQRDTVKAEEHTPGSASTQGKILIFRYLTQKRGTTPNYIQSAQLFRAWNHFRFTA